MPQGSDALMSAADRGHVNIVKALLAKGASVMKANRYVRCTEALHPPPRRGYLQVSRTH